MICNAMVSVGYLAKLHTNTDHQLQGTSVIPSEPFQIF